MTTLSTGTAMATVAFALSRGLTTVEIQEVTGVSCFELFNPETRPPEDVMPNILALLGERFPGEPFALEMARAAPFSYFGGLADGAQFADDLRGAVELFTRNSAVIADQLVLDFREETAESRLVSRHPMDAIDGGRSTEVGTALAARLFTDFLGVANCIQRIRYTHEPNCDVTYYLDYLGVPVEFNAHETALVFDAGKLGTRIKHANVVLFNYVKTHLVGLKKQIALPKEPREMTSLRKAAAENALAGIFGAASVAAAANMSLRSAQRLTAENGTSVQGLIDNIREDRAREFLSDGSIDLNSIALLLGYSDERAFRRAFQRWTGQSPSDYRGTLKRIPG
ncbi:AraC family transcriptional regulator [Candidatus Poribacteria bacterium]|nr:AraC family transcriptional regulator [Gammaproteobacteria bacterium]MYF97750.1 AraC family transcriptional regulator [Candidatus Poribacteria bacterium]